MIDLLNKLMLRHFLFLFTLSLLACNADDEQKVEELEGDTGEQTEQLILSKIQFATSHMELGKMQQYSFGTSIKINGLIDVPPEGRAEISNYYGGYVRNLKLITGQAVKKGDVLFTLENPEYVQMQQDFLETQSMLSYLASDYKRQQTLSEENIASQKNFLKAKSAYETALARSEGLKKKLALLNIQSELVKPDALRSQISIIAPFSGYITEVNIVNGAFLSPADIAIKMINTDHIHLDLHVLEKHIPMLREGQTIQFRLPDSRESIFEAEVFMIGKTIEAQNRMVNVHAHLKDESQNNWFTPGMYVEAELFSEDEAAMALPSEAIVEVEGTYYVLVKKEETENGYVFDKAEVQLGQSKQGLTAISNFDDFPSSTEFLVKGAFNLIN